MASTEEIVQQLIGQILSDPQSVQTIAEHPYSAVRQASGQQDVSRDQVAQAISLLGGLASGRTIDYGKVEGKASQQLAEYGGSAHSMAESLLGGIFGFTETQTQKTTTVSAVPQTSGISMDVLANLANVAFGSGIAGSKIDLSDGVGIDDILGIAGIASKFLS